jgi:hypothetical protein
MRCDTSGRPRRRRIPWSRNCWKTEFGFLSYANNVVADRLDTEALFDLTAKGLDYYTRWLAAPYPYAKYSQMFAFADDRLPSTHPVASGAATVSDAIANFDGISSDAKGAAVLRQLSAYVGEENFTADCAATSPGTHTATLAWRTSWRLWKKPRGRTWQHGRRHGWRLRDRTSCAASSPLTPADCSRSSR